MGGVYCVSWAGIIVAMLLEKREHFRFGIVKTPFADCFFALRVD
jgi:hypothetical protein